MKKSTIATCLFTAAGALAGVCATLAVMAADPPAPSLPDLQQSLVDEAAGARQFAEVAFRQGRATQSEISFWQNRETEARLALAKDKSQRIALLKELVDQAQRNLSLVTLRAQTGLASALDTHSARYDLLLAQIRLAKAQQE